MPNYRITYVAGSKAVDKEVTADMYNTNGEFIEFATQVHGPVFAVRAKDVASVELIKK
ncbi:MAG: hypothetical protein M3P18_10195 [Actinomycetota bacterium]|nr:hypothetical protein [Actinomycetota bacterium]